MPLHGDFCSVIRINGRAPVTLTDRILEEIRV